MANKYVYCVWDDTLDQPRNDVEYFYLNEAQDACWFEHKYGLWSGAHEFSIRRRLRTPAWEEIS